MKLLLILLFTVNTAFSDASFDVRVDALGDDIRLHMDKCGFIIPNMALFKKTLKEDMDDAKITCLESKVVEVAEDSSDQASIDSSRETAKANIRARTDEQIRNLSVPELNEMILDMRKAMGL